MNRAIKFWAPWCAPCKVLTKELDGVENLTSVNIDEDKEGLAREYKIRSIPTIVFVDQDNKEVDRVTGVVSKEDYRKALGNDNRD